MNARSKLFIVCGEDSAVDGEYCDALRELDQLLAAFVVLNTIQCEDWADQNAQLIERAAQAGYGEK